MIVIDVGCARYGGDFSIERLIEMFHPDVLYGFDPAWRPNMYTPETPSRTLVMPSTEAAWTHDGRVPFLEDGLNGQVGSEGWPLVPCIDLARFIDMLPAGPVVLKLDCEGAEYELLEHLIKRNVDARLDRVLVEWHPRDGDSRRRKIERSLTCPIEEWRW
jgi:hypothetical protein